ncbi:MAG: hypothetical protein EOP56_18110 [Sphingobacteriales bacterium]|nr:MAG: hypothetical protein EOP56_18110 [Sphingobacteriales bacterium]
MRQTKTQANKKPAAASKPQVKPTAQAKQPDFKAIKAKAEELTAKHGTTVHPLVFIEPLSKEQVVGYVKEPTRQVKMYAMDKMHASPSTAGVTIFESGLIKEESDPRLYTESPDNDKYYLGAIREVVNLVTVAINQLKK